MTILTMVMKISRLFRSLWVREIVTEDFPIVSLLILQATLAILDIRSMENPKQLL